MKFLYKVVAVVLGLSLIPTFLGERVMVDGLVSDALGTLGLIVLASGYLTIFWLVILPAADCLYSKGDDEPSPEELEKARKLYGDAGTVPSSLLASMWMTHAFGSIAIAAMLLLAIGVSLMAPRDLDDTDSKPLNFSEKLGILCHGIVTGCGLIPSLITSPLILLVWAAKATLEGKE